jgi:DNA-binding response OmpR family regulator
VRHIAVVDDEPLICALIEDVFEDAGAYVRCATTGCEAAEMLVETLFDLALIDVVLPDASGLALAEIAANNNTPVLLMTGHPGAAPAPVRVSLSREAVWPRAPAQ